MISCLDCETVKRIEMFQSTAENWCNRAREEHKELETWRAAAIAGWLLAVGVMVVACWKG